MFLFCRYREEEKKRKTAVLNHATDFIRIQFCVLSAEIGLFKKNQIEKRSKIRTEAPTSCESKENYFLL